MNIIIKHAKVLRTNPVEIIVESEYFLQLNSLINIWNNAKLPKPSITIDIDSKYVKIPNIFFEKFFVKKNIKRREHKPFMNFSIIKSINFSFTLKSIDFISFITYF